MLDGQKPTIIPWSNQERSQSDQACLRDLLRFL